MGIAVHCETKTALKFLLSKECKRVFQKNGVSFSFAGISGVKADKTVDFTAIKWGIKKCAEVLQNWRYSGRGRRAQAVSFPVPFRTYPQFWSCTQCTRKI